MEVTRIDSSKVDVGLAVQSTATLASKEEDDHDLQPVRKEHNDLVEMSMTSLLIKSKQSSGTNQVVHHTATKTDGFETSI